MSFTDFQQSLLMCISSTDPVIQNAANTANEYTEMLKRGEISKEEYQQLLTDIQSQIAIDQNMAELDAKEKLHTAINGLISIACAV
jgi:polyhydroxyalkanoate synthesis regulator phasin